MMPKIGKTISRGFMVKIQRLVLALLLSGLVMASVTAEIRFQSLDLNEQNQLLFRSEVDAPIYGSYGTGFLADLASGKLSQLSFFPEQITWLGAAGELQVQNRYGVFRSHGSLGGLQAVVGFPGFLNGGEIRSGKLGPARTSPDGKFLIFQRETSPAYGDLVMLNLLTSKETIVSSHIELSLEDLSIRWSPDSGTFVYQKDNHIYYYSIAQYATGRMLAESLRSLGPGQIYSIEWGLNSQLYYVSGSLVYEILSAELFTRSLYQDFLKIGRIIGRLPHLFDPNFDRFWVSPNGSKILLDKGGSNVFLYLLKTDDYVSDGSALELPYLVLPRNASLNSVAWSSSDRITLLTRIVATGGAMTSLLYRLDAAQTLSSYRFTVLEAPIVREMVLSPDESRLALLTPDGLQIRSYDNWKIQADIKHPDPLHLVYTDNDSMVLAGRYFTEKLEVGPNKVSSPTPSTSATAVPTQTDSLLVTRSFLFFSQIELLGFDQETGFPVAKSGAESMTLDNSSWLPRTPVNLREPATANGEFRVYLENLYSGPYANLVMIRKAKEVGTFQLFNPPKTAYEDFPVTAAGTEKIDFTNFEHGSRQRGRQISLTFNGIDSTEGLPQVLETLRQYNVRATFFLNGEFIRRFPGAVRQIAEAGHEVGSLFYMYFNLSDARYQINRDFIKQGLARNEDDYFQASGKELSLLWRTPYYIVSDEIMKAGKELNYTLVGKDVEALDYVAKGQNTGSSQLYYPSAKLVEMVLEQKKPGSVIALTLGRPGYDDNPAQGRDDYLFSKLDLLINNLLQRGYSIVPVSTLIEAAR